jgi:hypothetical protein
VVDAATLAALATVATSAFAAARLACKKRRKDPAFVARLKHWLDALGERGFATFVCSGIESRLLDDNFCEHLERWRLALGNDGFVTFMSDSVAARLEKPAFTAALEHWLTKLGRDGFVTFMRGGVAARLQIPAFELQMNDLHSVLGTTKFCTFCHNGSVVKQIAENRHFYDTILDVATQFKDNKRAVKNLVAALTGANAALLKAWAGALPTTAFHDAFVSAVRHNDSGTSIREELRAWVEHREHLQPQQQQPLNVQHAQSAPVVSAPTQEEMAAIVQEHSRVLADSDAARAANASYIADLRAHGGSGGPQVTVDGEVVESV